MNKKASLLIELLLIIMLISTTLPLTYTILDKTFNLSFDYYEIQDYISTVKLRRILALSYDIEIDDNGLSFEYLNEKCHLYLKNNKIILKKGVQFFYIDINEATFYYRDDLLILNIKRNENEKEVILAKKKSFSIPLLFDSDDVSIEY